MTDEISTLVETLEKYNQAYRSGRPVVSDSEYDALVEELAEKDPGNSFLHTVEPEAFDGKVEIRHPVPMLSTEKAYVKEQLERFVARVLKAAGEIDVRDIGFRVTPKLDGLAGRDDGAHFATRGNGEVGYEISSAFAKGVIPIGGRGKGIGEIVVSKSYFEDQLSGEFEHPRNMVVGIIASDKLNESAAKALEDGAVHFVPYSELDCWEGSAAQLLDSIESITLQLTESIDYPVDGVVVEATDDAVRTFMGATAHHYRWQIAVKTKGETAVTTVSGMTWQVGRTGNVTPVMEVEPVLLSGATIRRVTAHNAGMVQRLGIGVGAEIEIIRSGEVIPKLEHVIKPIDDVQLPAVCPSCLTPIEWQNDFLKCKNPDCRAQAGQRLSHWFKTLGTADWFGIKTINRLVEGGFDSLQKVYGMEESDFLQLGFGPVQSKNLKEALGISLRKPVEDWRFLAAFGVPDLGKGDSRKLLAKYPLEDLLDVGPEQILAIDGFGDITSQSIFKGLQKIRHAIEDMISLGFNIERSFSVRSTETEESPISGKRVVFTGKMNQGSREEMQESARAMGAVVQTAVSGKTDLLVCGENVGAKKIEKARKLNIQLLSEEDYLSLIRGG